MGEILKRLSQGVRRDVQEVPDGPFCHRKGVPVPVVSEGPVVGQQNLSGQYMGVLCLKEKCPIWVPENKLEDGRVEPAMCGDLAKVLYLRGIRNELADQTFLTRLPNKE